MTVRSLALLLSLPLVTYACGTSDPDGDRSEELGGATSTNTDTTTNTNTGGVTNTGTGGVTNTGGTNAIGGTLNTGGTDSGGGSSTGGWATSGGGTPSTGGHGDGGSDSGGTGGSGGESEFNPCPTNGDPCKILPFGDSITNGVGSSDQGSYRSKLFALAVAANQKITFTGSQNAGPTQVAGLAFPRAHEGHSGWTIESGYVSYGEGITNLVPSPAFDSMPHIVLLMIGTNDVNADHGQDQIADRLDGLLEKIVQTAPNGLVVVAQITPIRWSPQALTDYNARIPGIVAAHASAGHHMIHVDMSQMPSSGLGTDGLHPNDEGYTYMANVWYSAIAEFLPN